MGRKNKGSRVLGFALVGIAGGAASIALQSTGYVEFLSPTLVAILGVLFGPWPAFGAATVHSIYAAATLSWHLPAPLLAAALSAQLLRKGVHPILPVVALLFSFALPELLFMERPIRYAATCARALVLANASAALALVVMWITPRRGRGPLRAHARTRLDHLLFGLAGGTVAFAAIVLLADRLSYAADASHQPAFDRLLWLVLVADAIGLSASLAYASMSRNIAKRLRLSLRQGKTRLFAERTPKDVAMQLIDALRGANQSRRRAETLRVRMERMSRELEELKKRQQAYIRLLRERTSSADRALKSYARTRAQFSAVMHEVPEPIILVDRAKRIERVNPAALRVLRYKQEELIGKPLSTLVPPNYIGEHPLDLRQEESDASSPRSRTPAVAPIRRADRSEHKMSVRIYPYVIGKDRHHVVTLRDPNQTKQALAALERARTVVAKAIESSNALIRSMSHEFRTPLHGIIAMLDMLRDEEMTPAGRQRLSVAKASARSLLKLANDVLDWTRVGSHALKFERRNFDIGSIVREVFAEITPQAATKNINLQFTETNLPRSLIGDPQRIKQVIGNLVVNAVKFTQQGEVCVKISYGDSQCTIDVSDTGPGIPPEVSESIFQPFVRGPQSHHQRQEGTGLGLAICKQICEGMGGKVWLLDSSPAGSTFRVQVPLEASAEAPEDEQSQRIFRNLRGRILVVEDHPTNQFVVQSMLDALKCEATIASSGREALELLERQEFDLVLMDCRMPGMDGLETTRRIRNELHKSLPIIAMTANTMPEDIQQCMEAGMNDYLAKPFGRSALHEMLSKWLQPAKFDAGSVTQRLAKIPVLDEAVFNELFENLKWQQNPMKRIRDTFLDTVRGTLRLLDEPNRDQLRRNLHTLLGTSGMIGARQIEHLAALLQEAVEQKKTEQIAVLKEKFELAIDLFEREFREKLDEKYAS